VFYPFLRKFSGVLPKPEVLCAIPINVETAVLVFIFFLIAGLWRAHFPENPQLNSLSVNPGCVKEKLAFPSKSGSPARY
jgi:hypothetical protein